MQRKPSSANAGSGLIDRPRKPQRALGGHLLHQAFRPSRSSGPTPLYRNQGPFAPNNSRTIKRKAECVYDNCPIHHLNFTKRAKIGKSYPGKKTFWLVFEQPEIHQSFLSDGSDFGVGVERVFLDWIGSAFCCWGFSAFLSGLGVAFLALFLVFSACVAFCTN
jgi:hypothetical protein